jgi:hypothetical protein
VSLGILHYDMQDLAAAERELAHALMIDPDDAIAHAAISYIHQSRGDAPRASQHRTRAFRERNLIRLPYHGDGEAIRVLYLAAADGSNAPLDAELDPTVFDTHILMPEYFSEGAALPAHDLLVVGIGDADAAPGALASAQSIAEKSPATVFNPPERVAACTRHGNWQRLRAIAGVRTPACLRLPKAALLAAGAAQRLSRFGLTFPLLLRATGFMGADHLYRVDDPADLALTIERIPSNDVLVIEYIDTRGAYGLYRKFRVLSIGGALMPVHVIIAHDWKLRARRAELLQAREHQSEEAHFLLDMPGMLGPRIMAALTGISDALALDYVGIDFAIDGNGELVLFEANPAMAVTDPPLGSHWGRRHEAVRRIRDTLRSMLGATAQRIAQQRALANTRAGMSMVQPLDGSAKADASAKA